MVPSPPTHTHTHNEAVLQTVQHIRTCRVPVEGAQVQPEVHAPYVENSLSVQYTTETAFNHWLISLHIVFVHVESVESVLP